jgi:hypothetical protein
MYNMGLVYFDQATKHCLLTLYIRAPLSLVLLLNQAQAGPGNQTHPTMPGDKGSTVTSTNESPPRAATPAIETSLGRM